ANFWHPARFRAELEALQQPAAARVVPGEPQGLRQLVRGLDPNDQQEARVRVQDYLSDKQFTTFGNRTTAELVDRLCDYAADAAHAPLPAQAAQLITSYAAIKAPPRAAGARIVDLVSTAGLKQSEALERYQRRTNLLAQATPDWSKCLFSAEFGREMAYYTGFVFQLDVPELGRGGRLAGGGRYDGLLPSAANAQSPLSAVGAAIHTERLLRAVAEGV
ncbi:MAG: ATP phosphoribosyltransferase regulatory subunit, partial [Pseudomonadota bacterium]